MCKKIIFLALLCLTSILLLSGCSGGSDELQAGYYGQIVMQPNGTFIGKDKIDDKKAATSGLVYKVEMNEQKKLSKITAMYNERPVDIGWFDTRYYQYSNFAVVALEYQDGYVKYNFKDASMQPVTGYYGAYSLRYKLNEKQIPTIAYCYDKDGEQKENADGFAQMLFTYDDTGVLIKVGYANSSGERVTTTWKEYEIKFKYDSNNKKNRLPIEVSNHGKDGELMLNAVGMAKKAYKYDDKGRLSEIRHFGTDGSLRERTLEKIDMDSMIGGIGAGAITKYKYEGERKLPSEIAFYGKDEQPVGVQALDNAASVKLKYGDQGNIAEVSAFGTDGLPRAINKDVFGKDVVTIKFSIDEFGNTIQKALYNKDGNLVAAKNEKFAIAKFKYNNKRQKIEESAFGTSEEPVETTDKGRTFHKKIMEYDDDGKITKTTYYDKNDKEINGMTQNNASMAKVYGRWYMNGPTSADSAHIIITAGEIIWVPLHDVDRIPKNTWKRTTYTVVTSDVNPNGVGSATLKFGDGSIYKLTFYSADTMAWNATKYTWKKQSDSTDYGTL